MPPQRCGSRWNLWASAIAFSSSPGPALGLAPLKTRTPKRVQKLQATFRAILTSQYCPHPATKTYPLKAPSVQSPVGAGAPWVK